MFHIAILIEIKKSTSKLKPLIAYKGKSDILNIVILFNLISCTTIDYLRID